MQIIPTTIIGMYLIVVNVFPSFTQGNCLHVHAVHSFRTSFINTLKGPVLVAS